MRFAAPTFALGCLLFALPSFAQRCDVWLLGKGLCACYENDHCSAGHGCLTKTCGKDSCRFPRICFCKPNVDPEGTSNCSPVKTGPCENCYPPESLQNIDLEKSTPRDALLWEYGTLNSFDLRERAAEAGLSTKGSDVELIGRLADFVLDQETIEA